MIKRYEYNRDPCVEDYVERDDGTVVYYTDHIAEVEALKARLAQFTEGMPSSQTLSRLITFIGLEDDTGEHQKAYEWLKRIASSAGGE